MPITIPDPKFNIGDKVQDTLNDPPNVYVIDFRSYSPEIKEWVYEDGEGAHFQYGEKELVLYVEPEPLPEPVKEISVVSVQVRADLLNKLKNILPNQISTIQKAMKADAEALTELYRALISATPKEADE